MITDDFGNLVQPAVVRSIFEQLDEGEARMGRIEGDVGDVRADLAAVRRDLEANTKATQATAQATQELGKSTADLVDFLQALKGMFKVLDWLGRMAKPIASILALGSAALALYAAWKGHK
ncbi:hypothetical protein PMI14_01328 [Acidovorax sp. CF316]|uniref:hypothetical protein n=1 Tax=Acidovorax sp. CF316 TaxID=1144317 RepID=UPI00026BC6B2|nr:hypothetical protein [Acidovorax sp. CF316]EJE53777.1 hypothetical protein PMI14_01328 [Acidovorax sp. CF316]